MPAAPATRLCRRTEDAVDFLIERFGPRLRVGTPLGLGKPNLLLNLLYERVKADPSRGLDLYTALSLAAPEPDSELARRFLGPFAARQWGTDYPALAYARDATRNRLPANIRVHEFYFQAGSALHASGLQRDYQSINYTHVAEALADVELQVIVQLVARGEGEHAGRFSLSCNPDLTLDAVDAARARGKVLSVIGVIHPELPFLGGDAEVGEDFFSLLVDDPPRTHALFALPRMPIGVADHAIGLHASAVIRDGGTLQVGIGSLSDAVVACLLLRQRDADAYRKLLQGVGSQVDAAALGPFAEGLYGLSEMVTDGFMHLRRAGILKRAIHDEKSGRRTHLHGAFFLGSKEFYAWLRGLRGEEFTGIRMSRVSKVNDLYDPHELTLRRQRVKARFLNTCMQVDLLGGAASETLPDGRVVSGVGGQYNFVAMSHELPDARSALMLRSSRWQGGRRVSNLVPTCVNLTIPRHLRDLVITEYGIADLRGKSDEDVAGALIEIADAEFQPMLVASAKRRGKLSASYQLPERARANTPAALLEKLRGSGDGKWLDPFPFGSDFTPEEARLAVALGRLESRSKSHRLAERGWLLRHAVLGEGSAAATRFSPELKRMGLDRPRGIRDRVYRNLVVSTLAED